jgi:hypothetical protein
VPHVQLGDFGQFVMQSHAAKVRIVESHSNRFHWQYHVMLNLKSTATDTGKMEFGGDNVMANEKSDQETWSQHTALS